MRSVIPNIREEKGRMSGATAELQDKLGLSERVLESSDAIEPITVREITGWEALQHA
ncbi:MAG: hypothetical protein IPK92_15730 [Nitrospira sp.]|nr:hypothetical protein [Nitrospira sp.]